MIEAIAAPILVVEDSDDDFDSWLLHYWFEGATLALGRAKVV